MGKLNKNNIDFEQWLYDAGIATAQHAYAWEQGEDPKAWKLANHGAVTVKLVDNKKVKVPARMWDADEMKDNWYTRGVAESNLRVVINELGHCMGWLNG